MSKRKAADIDDKTDPALPMIEGMAPKAKKTTKEGSYTSAQKSAISEFTSVTQSDKSSAGKLLKQHNWNVSAAVNAFFSNANNGATNPIRTTMTRTFDRYRDDPNNEPDEINAEGTEKLLHEMNVGLDDIGSLVFSQLVASPTLGKITRDGFVDGTTEVGADSIAKLCNVILQRRSQLATDRELFRKVYNHTFLLGLSNNQRSLASDVAIEFWRMLFSGSGYDWRTSRSPWLAWWIEFQEEKFNKAINKDLWMQTLTFAEETMKDDSLGFWSEESSWPSVIDDFVEWVKTEKRGGEETDGDAMDVE